MAVDTLYYPPAHSDTYVKATSKSSTSYWPYYATDPAKSLIGGASSNSWQAPTDGSQKFNIDLGDERLIDGVYVENFHASADLVTYGAKDCLLYGTNSSTAFANTTYSNVDDLTLLHSFALAMHPYVNATDPQYIEWTPTVAYRYYVLRIVNNYGGAYLGFRRITPYKKASDDGIGNIAIPSIDVSGAGGGFGGAGLSEVTVSGQGGGFGGVTVGTVEVAGEGAGSGGALLNNITISATGDDSIPMKVQGDLGIYMGSSITMASRSYGFVQGDLGFYAESGISILNNAAQGDLGFFMESSIQMTPRNNAAVRGDLGIFMESGITLVSHTALNVGGDLGLYMTSSIELEADKSISVTGELGFFMESGISMHTRPQIAVQGKLGFFMESGITADSGDTRCSGVLTHVRGQVC